MLPRDKKFKLWILFIATLSTVLLALSNSTHGLALSNDSVAYWAAAKSFYLDGEFYLSYREGYFAFWPPLVSMLLASGYWLGYEEVNTLYASIQVYTLYFLLVCMFGYMAFRFTKSVPLALAGTLLFIFPPSTQRVFSYLWSESYFIFFTIIFLTSLARLLSAYSRRLLFFCALFAGLSALTRYSGIVNIALGCLFLFFYPNRSIKFRLKDAFLFGLTSTLPLLLWVMRNVYLTDSFTGPTRPIMFAHPEYTLIMLVKACWEWLLPYRAVTLGGVLTTSIAAVIAAGLTYSIYRFWKVRAPGYLFLAILGVYTCLYLAITFVAAVLKSSTEPDFRLTAPAFFSFLLILIYTFHYIYNQSRQPVRYMLLAVGSFLLAYNFIRYTSQLYYTYVQGLPSHNIESLHSPLVVVLKESNLLDSISGKKVVFTNYPEKLYFHGISGVSKVYEDLLKVPTDKFLEKTPLKVIIWFGDVMPLDNLKKTVFSEYTAAKIERFPDGVILWLTLHEEAPLQDAERPL